MALPFELRPQRRIQAQLLAGLEDPAAVQGHHHHPIAYLRGMGYVVLAVAWWALMTKLAAPAGMAVVSVALLLWGVSKMISVYEDIFVVTDCRILRIQGILNQRVAAMSLSRIVDFTMEQPFLGQVLDSYKNKGYGHLVFENAAQDQGLREIRHLAGVVALNNLIQERVFEAGGGPAKHKKAVKAVVVGSETDPAAWNLDPTDGWGTYGDPMLDDPDATGQIPRVPDED